MSRIVIKSDGLRCTTVEVDGVAITSLTNVEFSHPVGELPRVSLHIMANEVVIEGDAKVSQMVFCPMCKDEMAENATSFAALNGVLSLMTEAE